MSLIIGATPFSQWERMEPLFQQLGWAVQLNDRSTLPAAVASTSSPCLLLHTRPELAVAQAMEQGASPGEALQQWQSAAQVLLDVLRANRSQCLMLEVNSVLKAPAQLLDWLKSNQPSLLTLPADTTGIAGASVEPSNDRNLLLATQLVAQNAKVQSLLAPLEASTVPLVSGQYSVPTVDIEQLRQQWQNELQECESLKQSLKKTQSQLEAAKNAQQQKHGSSMQSQAANDKQHKEVLNQLFKVQEELEKYHLQTKELKEQVRVASRDLGQAQKKLKAMESSPFWRITAPARLGLGLVKTLLRKTKRFLARR